MKMKGVLLAVVLIAFPSVAAANQKIGYVTMAQVFNDLAKKEGLQDKLKREFQARITEVERLDKRVRDNLQRLQRDGQVMSDADRTKLQRDLQAWDADLKIKATNLREDQAKRFEEEQRKLIQKIQVAVQTVASRDGYDMVLDRQAVIYANAKDDLSAKVLRAIK